MTNDKNTDSSQVAHVERSGKRKHTSIRIDSGLWESFDKACKADGQRTCEVLELIILGYTTGVTTQHRIGAQMTTINVTANLLKEIKRERRYAREAPREDEFEGAVHCVYDTCLKPAVVRLEKEIGGRIAHCFVCADHAEVQRKNGWR